VVVLWYSGHLILTGKLSGDNIVPYVLYQFDIADVLNHLGSVYTGRSTATGATLSFWT